MIFNPQDPPLPEGTEVSFTTDSIGTVLTGRIRGIAQVRQAVIGYQYIVELSLPSQKALAALRTGYAYSCVAQFEMAVTVVKND